MVAWQLYADDNRGNFAPNVFTTTEANDATTSAWVKGWLKYGDLTANTTIANLMGDLAVLGPVLKKSRTFITALRTGPARMGRPVRRACGAVR